MREWGGGYSTDLRFVVRFRTIVLELRVACVRVDMSLSRRVVDDVCDMRKQGEERYLCVEVIDARLDCRFIPFLFAIVAFLYRPNQTTLCLVGYM